MSNRRVQEGFFRPDTVPPITEVYRMLSPTGMAKGHEPHYHPDTIEVCFVAHGHLDWWAADEAYELKPGDAIVVPPGVPHGSVDSTLQPCEYYALHLAPDELPPNVAALAKGLNGHYARRPDVGETLRRVFEAHRDEETLLPEVGAALAVLLVASLARGVSVGGDRKAGRVVRQAQAELEREGATVERAAKNLGVSTVWLNRLFGQELGQSPGEWMRARRMAEAKRLLALDRAPITDIAIRLGYGSSQYFATAFRHECGMTPSAYRTRCATTWTRREAAVSAPTRGKG